MKLWVIFQILRFKFVKTKFKQLLKIRTSYRHTNVQKFQQNLSEFGGVTKI